MVALIRDIRVGLPRQVNIITSLALREFRLRNRRFAFSLLFDLGEMLISILVLSAIAIYMMRKPPIGDSEILFIATGLLPIHFFRHMSSRTAAGVQLRTQGRAVPYVTVLDAALAKSVVEIIMFSFTMIVVIFVCHEFVESKFAIPYNPIALLEALASMFVFGFGIGLCNAVIRCYVPVWRIIWSILTRVQIFTSGVHQLPDHMLPQLRELVFWNPLAHMVALSRTAFYPMYPHNFIDMNYANMWAFLALVLGLAVQQVMKGRVAAN